MTKIRLKRNGTIWKNGQSGEDEEVLDVFLGENLNKRFTRRFCNDAFKAIAGIELSHGEEVIVNLEVLK